MEKLIDRDLTSLWQQFSGVTVDGSEIPFPTTWRVLKPGKEWDIVTTNLNW